MSNYQAYPPPPPVEGYGQPTPAAEPPPSIKTAVSIVWAMVALSVLSAIVTVVFLDDIVRAAGVDLGGSQEDAARAGAIAGAVIGVLIFGALWIVLAIFLRRGANWARIVLTVLAGIGLLSGIYSLSTGQHALLLILGLLQMALYVALLFFLWRRDSSDYINGRRAAPTN